MKYIKDTTWEEVFEGWRKREAHNPEWIHCATFIKGWSDWESWRGFSASQIKAEKRQWQIFEFTDPIHEIPKMLVGPFSSWQERFPQKNTGSFEDILHIPDYYAEFSKHIKVVSIMNNLPFSMDFIGIVRDDTDQIVCLEGHHRAIAVALGQRQGKQIDFSATKITIALAHLPNEEIFLLDEMLRRGSMKNSKDNNA